MFGGCIFLALLTIACMRLLTDPVTIIVSKDHGFVELFVKTPAVAVEDVFDVPLSGFLSTNGTVDFQEFSQGTWDYGDLLFSHVVSSIDETQVKFESMSLMFHANAEAIPFETALDAILAISVCNSATRQSLSSFDGVDFFAGYFAEIDSAGNKIRLSFPKQDWQPTLVRIRHYSSGHFTASTWTILTTGHRDLLF